jgi:hypothetical protein
LAVWPAVEPKAPAIRAKLSLKPEPPVPAETSVVTPETAPPDEPVADAASVPAPVKPVLVPRVKPTLIARPEEGKAASDSGATPPFGIPASSEKKLPAVLNAPPPKIKVAMPNAETWPAVLDAPPPVGLPPLSVPSRVASTEAEPAEITAIRKASTFPFPQPTAKFPPLPGLGGTGGTEPGETENPEGFLKKALLIGGAVLLVLLVGAGFAYFKFFAKPAAKPAAPPPPSVTQAQPAPAQPAPKVKQMIEKVTAEQFAPLNEVVAADPSAVPTKTTVASAAPAAASATSVETPTAEPVIAPPPAPVKPPPPPPSLAFKAWVVNLKIRGVRGGEGQRVFIEKISYVPGDLVNQQLGIIFVGYNEETRMLTFVDKTGATFERRH